MSRRELCAKATALATVPAFSTSAVADSGDLDSGREYPKGPLAEDGVSFEEAARILESEDNGSVQLVDGSVRNTQKFVGDDSEAEIESYAVRPAESGSWTIDCRNPPIPYVGEVCTELTATAYTWGAEVDLIVYGWPVVGAGVEYADSAATFKYNVPKIPVKGEATIGATDISGDSAVIELENELCAGKTNFCWDFTWDHEISY